MSKKKEEQNQLEQRVTDLESLLKRAVADYQNLEKRVAQGRSELTKWGTGELLVKLLPSIDHLEQALAGANEEDRKSGWFRGVELAVKELNQVLQSEGLGQIITDGQFDPNLHEAVDTQELSDAEAMEGKGDNMILKVVRKGYTVNGKVLRPAGVVVGRKTVIASEVTPKAGEVKQSATEEEEKKGELSS